MSSILTTFGIDWRLLLINALNFGLLMLGLWYFLYGPVVRMLEERRKRVAQGVEDAEKSKLHLAEIDAARAQKLAGAAKEADEILARTRAAASVKERELVAQAESRAEVVVKDAQAQALELKSQAIEESKKEVAKLIVLGMEKLAK